MKKEMKEYLRNEIKEFVTMTQRFVDKEVDMKTYKGYSGGFGSYAQRGGERFMLRLRMNQGIITKQRLTFLIDTLQRYDIDKLHLTTCQTCQLHNVQAKDLGVIMGDALDYDIVTRGGGGDFPRNVMCSPLSGIDPDEYFDVLPYASALGEYVLSKIHTYHLPRKLKIAFSNGESDKAHTTFRDLGFCANSDGTFDVYIAGGLGNNPKMGICVEEHIDPTRILYSVEAMVKTFQAHGNYENRAKARTRYMQESLGVDGLKQAYLASLEEVQNLDLTLHDLVVSPCLKVGEGTIEDESLIKQKQPGLYALRIHPRGGDIALDRLLEVARLILPMPEVEMRISPQQDLYIINLTAQEAKQVLPMFPDRATTEFECSVACIGASICQVGVRDSQALLQTIFEAVLPHQFPDGVLPRIHISGCPSSCGTHQIASLGFQGSVKVIDKKAHNAFVLSIFGQDGRNDARFGDVCGTILENEIPNFLVELGTAIQAKQTTFAKYKDDCLDEFKSLIAKYTA